MPHAIRLRSSLCAGGHQIIGLGSRAGSSVATTFRNQAVGKRRAFACRRRSVSERPSTCRLAHHHGAGNRPNQGSLNGLAYSLTWPTLIDPNLWPIGPCNPRLANFASVQVPLSADPNLS